MSAPPDTFDVSNLGAYQRRQQRATPPEAPQIPAETRAALDLAKAEQVLRASEGQEARRRQQEATRAEQEAAQAAYAGKVADGLREQKTGAARRRALAEMVLVAKTPAGSGALERHTGVSSTDMPLGDFAVEDALQVARFLAKRKPLDAGNAHERALLARARAAVKSVEEG